MIVEPSSLTYIADKQFEIIGEKIKFKDIPDSGVITIPKKKTGDYWYNLFKFTEEQEKEWRQWALKELSKITDKPEYALRSLELKYGFSIRYKKKGELF